jgi:hypothetical protein
MHRVLSFCSRHFFSLLFLVSPVICTGLLASGCSGEGADGEDVGADGGGDGGIADGGGAPDENPAPPLADLSEGECPDMTTSGISTFRSAGLDRKVAVLFPENPQKGLPVIFNFHGLTSPEYLPVEASEASLQAEANARQAIFVVPEARVQTIQFVGTFLLWGIMDDEAPDLILFDDLRTCVSQEFAVDLKRISVWGHSGGALWNSAMLMNRSEVLASVVEFSGGAEFSVPFIGGPFLAYETPTNLVPVFLATGGPMDVWPNADQPMIEFEDTTDTLQEKLATDGHVVVRCRHALGHNGIPTNGWDFSHEWMLAHRLGDPSPYVESGLGDEESWCSFVAADGTDTGS